MKKSIILLLLLCSSMVSFSQGRITTRSHPFQVLFAENAFIDKNEVRPFDYIKNKSKIYVEGNITLVHFSNRVFDFNDTVISVDKILKLRNKMSHRPPMDERMICFLDCPQFSINFPPDYNYTHNRDSALRIIWSFDPDQSSTVYQISITSIFNEMLYQIETSDNEIIIPPGNLQTEEGLIVVRLQAKHHQSEVGVKIIEEANSDYQMDYQLLLIAIEMSFKRVRVANDFFQRAIQESNQDPRFIQLYEDFLERNPQFKENSE